jgi:uncharacterized RDD family membrane protein YckC
MLDIVDPNVLLDHVDVDGLIEKVDVNALLERVDVNQLLDRVDVNRLLERVDVDQLMARVDVNALMDRVDVERVVERAGIPGIVAESTSHLTGSALDLIRRPLVGLDELIFRALNRLIGRDPSEFPQGPEQLVAWVDSHREPTSATKTGRYAGPLTRLLAVVIDASVIGLSFSLMVALVIFLIGLVAQEWEPVVNRGVFYGVLAGIWSFIYLWVSIAVFGKTIGKMVVGLRVVSRSGEPGMHRKEPLVRVLTYPLSFLVLGLGLLGVVFNRERQAWHDRLAGTAVVYDWGSRTATLPTPLADYLSRKTENA